MHNPALENLIQSSLTRVNNQLEWIPCSEITDINSIPTDAIYYATRKHETIILVLLGNSEECTQTSVSEFARIYSLPTHKYNNDVNQFRRYKRWLEERNKHIIGFTKSNGNYYMATHLRFYLCYTLYGFCPACGILRCSPVWCICGHKQLSNGLTSNNKQLDEFIKKSQLQTNSPNDAYLEWIFGCIGDWRDNGEYLFGLPTTSTGDIQLIPLEITDETNGSYYDKVTIYLYVMFIE